MWSVHGVALEDGPYSHKYRAAQFHFHWGKTSEMGAEHLVDGKTYAAEVNHVLYTVKLLIQAPGFY